MMAEYRLRREEAFGEFPLAAVLVLLPAGIERRGGQPAGPSAESLAFIRGAGMGIGELAELYGKARVAGTLFAEDINQLTGRGIPVIQQFAAQLGVTEGEIKKLASEGKVSFKELETAFLNMTSPGGPFSGMMAQLSGTMEGTLSTLKDNANMILTGIGAEVNDAVKPLLKSLADEPGGLEGAGKRIGETIGLCINMAVEGIKDGSLVTVLKTGLASAALTLADTLVDAADKVGNVISAKMERAAVNSVKEASEQDKADATAAVDLEMERLLSDQFSGSRDLEEAKDAAQQRHDEAKGKMLAAGLKRQGERRDAEAKNDEDRKMTPLAAPFATGGKRLEESRSQRR